MMIFWNVARGLRGSVVQRMQRDSGGPGEKHVFEWKSDVEDRRRREIGPHGSRREGASDGYWKLEEAIRERTEYRREEDGNEDATMDSDTCESLRKDERFSECVNKAIKATARFQAEDVVALEDVCVFVDPVDGTREFVEGRLENCQCLVGISVSGRAVAGAIGLPFPKGLKGFEEDKDDAEKSAVMFGLWNGRRGRSRER